MRCFAPTPDSSLYLVLKFRFGITLRKKKKECLYASHLVFLQLQTRKKNTQNLFAILTSKASLASSKTGTTTLIHSMTRITPLALHFFFLSFSSLRDFALHQTRHTTQALKLMHTHTRTLTIVIEVLESQLCHAVT